MWFFANYLCCLYLHAVPTNDTCDVDGSIRLAGGLTEYEGRVEICYDNQWGTVCDDAWSSFDATVACRQLGHNPTGQKSFTDLI